MNFEGNEEDFPGPGQGLIIQMQQQQQREFQAWHQMQMMEIKTSMENFMDGLTAEQCLELSRMVQLFIGNPQYLHVVIGQLSVMMRHIHKVCGMCGDVNHSTVEHLTAEQADMMPSRPDYGWLAGLSPAEQIERLYVGEDVTHAGAYICNNCDAEFSTLFARASHGKDCPQCSISAHVNTEQPDDKLSVGGIHFRYRVAESRNKEDVMVCIDCGTEFLSLKFRMKQGLECPNCKIQPEVERDEGLAGPA